MKGKCLLSADAYVWLHVNVIEQLQVCRQCICHVEMQQVSLLFDSTVMMFYIKWSAFDSHPLSVLFFLFSFWVNPLSFYCCKHLANEPILRQWPLLPIKALKPAEDLLGQETREKERETEINIWTTNKKEWLRWFSQALMWTLHFEEYLQPFVKPTGSQASACERYERVTTEPGSPAQPREPRKIALLIKSWTALQQS